MIAEKASWFGAGMIVVGVVWVLSSFLSGSANPVPSTLGGHQSDSLSTRDGIEVTQAHVVSGSNEPVTQSSNGDLRERLEGEIRKELARFNLLSSDELSALVGKIVVLGDAAIPFVAHALSSGQNTRFTLGAELTTQHANMFPTSRIGLFSALRQIGSPGALTVALKAILNATDNHEVFEVAQLVVSLGKDPIEYREELLDGVASALEVKQGHQERVAELVAQSPHGARFSSDAETFDHEAYATFREELERINEKYAPTQVVGHLEFELIDGLGGLESFSERILGSGRSGIEFLARRLEPHAALDLCEDLLEDPDVNRADAVYGLASIPTDSALSRLSEVYVSLEDRERRAALEALASTVNQQDEPLNPFEPGFDYRSARKVRTPTDDRVIAVRKLLVRLERSTVDPSNLAYLRQIRAYCDSLGGHLSGRD